MKRLTEFLLVPAMVFLGSCSQQASELENTTQPQVSFKVEVENPYFIYHEPTKSEIVTDDGAIALPLTCKITEGINCPYSETKGVQYEDLNSLGNFSVTAYNAGGTKKLDSRTVKYYKGSWTLQDNPIVWPKNATMTFYASANLGTGSSIPSFNPSSITFTNTVQSTAAAQRDVLIGYYCGTGGGFGVATLKFNHPLTAVVFKVGGIVTGDKSHTVTGIQSISLSGVYASGSATTSASGDVLSYNWTPSGSTTVSEPLSGPEGTAGETFLLIPQNLGDQNVTLTAVLTTATGTKNASVTLNSDNWEAGKTNTYIIGYNDYIKVESISLNKSATTIKKTDTETLIATILPADADNKTVTWTTSDSGIATVDASGKITAKGVGTCTITATPADGVTPATCNITVTNPVTSIVLDNSTLVLAQSGEKSQKTLVATVTYYDGTTKKSNATNCVTWTSSNTSVATISENGGLITANVDKGSGSSVIRATTIDKAEDGNSMSTTCSLSVPYISIAPTCFITNGTSGTLYTQTVAKTIMGGTSPSSITFYVDNSYGGSLEYVIISDATTGAIQGHYAGTARVYAVADFGNGITSTSNDCIVTVGPAAAENQTEIDLSPEIMNLSPQEEGQATVNMRYHLDNTWQSDQNVNWTTSNAAIAVVNAQGIITGVASGTCTVTATSQYTPTSGSKVSKSLTVNVSNLAHVTLNRTALGIVVGNSFNLTATVTHSDGTKDNNVNWSTSASGVATVDNSGHVTGVSVGTAIITATSQTEPSLSGTCTVTVTSSEVKVTGVTLNKNTIVIASGSTGEVIATVAPSNATNQNVTWTSSNTNVVTVGGTGTTCTLTAIGIGKATVTVTTSDGGYQASCTVLVPGVVIPGSTYYGSGCSSTKNGLYLFGTTNATTPICFSVFPAEVLNYVNSVSWTVKDASKFTVTWDGSGKYTNTATIVYGYSFSDVELSVSMSLTTGQNLSSNKVSVNKQASTWGSISAIQVTPTSITAAAGSLTTVSAGVNNQMSGGTKYGDTNVRWSSSNDEIAVVVADGNVLKVRALKAGSCTITATSAWDSSKSASINVTVN